MERKEIQEKRMKGYFIEAAKEILKGEGLKALSVRNIAEKAGYSFATLYNYFRDQKDLLYLCLLDFQDECREFVKSETASAKNGREKIKKIVSAYVKYFVQYPGIFEIFFIESMTDISKKKETSETICLFLDRLCDEEWEYCVKNGIFTSKEAAILREEILFFIHGILLLYNNRMYPGTYQEFTKRISEYLDRKLSVT